MDRRPESEEEVQQLEEDHEVEGHVRIVRGGRKPRVRVTT